MWMARHLATIGRLTVWLNEPANRQDELPTVTLVADSKYGAQLSLDQFVELSRLGVKTAAQHGWGSDEERERVIAWAKVKK
jgi:hypothetical protein